MRDKQREDTRRRIFQAALAVFRQDGVAQCRIDDIAKKAEVSRGAFYFHFPTKDHVLIELLRESEGPIVAALNALPPTATLHKVIDTLADALAAFWASDRTLLPDVATVALRLNALIEDREAEPVRHVLSERFRLAAARGELSFVLPAEVLSDFFLANSLSAMLAWCATPSLQLEVVLKGVCHLFLHGAHGGVGTDGAQSSKKV